MSEYHSELSSRYGAIRSRLFNPPNAVEDDGIDLNRPKKGWTVLTTRKPSVRYIEPITKRPLKREPFRPMEDAHVMAYHRHKLAELTGEEQAPSGREIAEDILSDSPYSWKDICSQRRQKDLVKWRFAVGYAILKETGMSLPELGRLMGKRDHSSQIHMRNSVEKAILDGKATECVSTMGRVYWLRHIETAHYGNGASWRKKAA